MGGVPQGGSRQRPHSPSSCIERLFDQGLWPIVPAFPGAMRETEMDRLKTVGYAVYFIALAPFLMGGLAYIFVAGALERRRLRKKLARRALSAPRSGDLARAYSGANNQSNIKSP